MTGAGDATLYIHVSKSYIQKHIWDTVSKTGVLILGVSLRGFHCIKYYTRDLLCTFLASCS